jgi:phage gp29-like protein
MLVDQYNRPLKRPAAKEVVDELSGPSIGSVRQIMSGHPADNLRPQRLAAILRNAEVSDPTEFLQMAEQFEEKDLHYAAVLGVRKRAVRKLQLVVEAGDDTEAAQDAAELVRKQLTSPPVRKALIDMMDALGKGFSVHEVMWNTSSPQWTIRALKYRDPSWFRFDQTDGETLRVRDNEGDKDLPPGKFVIHRAKTKSGLTIRGGLARLAAWAYIFKNYSLRDWAIFLTTYGHPMRVGKYDTNATEADKQTLLRAVRQIGTDLAAIMPQSMEVDFIDGAVTGGEAMFEKSARYWDEQLSKGILGQVATTDAIAGGHAVGKIHEQVRDDIRDADGEQLAATLQSDLAAPLVAWNLGPNVPCPEISLVSPEEHDPRLLMAAAKTFGGRGLKVPVAVVRDAFGIRAPEDDEEVLDFSANSPLQPSRAGSETPLHPQTATAAAARAGHLSAIDRFIDRVEEGQFDDVTDPLIAGFVEALQGAVSLEEARDILAELADTAPDGTFTEFLTNLGFNVRLAGELGADIDR